ncbi:hypothetical protein [Luteolibacter marinus]|uniref:hypothetical protein n=1 Tax=Luteolibacter marinus TaxID=2776705 RepID=UPI001868006C|nr:hypothetical protein [Luteolibacter marinus]
MKVQAPLLLGAVTMIAAVLTWTSGVKAGDRNSGAPVVHIEDCLEDVIDQQCVVSIDPDSVPTTEFAGSSNTITGFVAPNTVRGVMVRIEPDWLVLRDGNSLNWVPREKVILIHVCL